MAVDILNSITNCIVYKCMQDLLIEGAKSAIDSDDCIAIEVARAEAVSLKNNVIVVEVGLIVTTI